MLTSDAYGCNGGIALYNRDVVEALAAMPEIDEIVIVPRNAPLPIEQIPDKARFMSAAAGSKFRHIRTVVHAARRPFDLVICGHINLLPLATMLGPALRGPLVLMVYGIDVWQSSYQFARQWLRKTHAVWAISATTQKRMNAWAALPESRYTVLPNAVHLDRYGMAERRPDLVARHRLEGCKVILTLAQLRSVDRYKGIDEVLDLLPSLIKSAPTLKYLIAGDGDDRPRLEAKVRALGLVDRVIFAGMIDESDKADYFRLADAFVMPGRGEGFGFVFLEALACGVPAVGSTLDGSREALLDGQLGELCNPDDHESIRNAICAAMAKPKGIPSGLSYYAWPAFAERVANAARRAIASYQH